jgi:hypothetical protein
VVEWGSGAKPPRGWCSAVALDERPAYRKPMWRTQVPVIVTIVNVGNYA